MDVRPLRSRLEEEADRLMPPAADLWPTIRRRALARRRARRVGRLVEVAAGVGLVVLLLALVRPLVDLPRPGTAGPGAAPAPFTVGGVPFAPDLPRELTPDEAADIACFDGRRLADGTPAYVGHQREIIVAAMTQGAARAFLETHGERGMSTAVALDPAVPVYLVVVRGAVTDRLGGPERPLGDALALVIDRRDRAAYASVGPQWATDAPVGGTRVPPRLVPAARGLSLARAYGALDGVPLLAPGTTPPGLIPSGILRNVAGVGVDPSRATVATVSVTVVYADSAGEPRLWLTQADGDIGVPPTGSAPTPVQIAGTAGLRHAWQQGERRFVTLVWRRGDRRLYLTVELGAERTEAAALRFADSLGDLTP